MTKSGLDLSGSDLPGQIQENMIAYMRLFAGLPGIIMHDSTESFWFVSNKPAPGNATLRARWLEEDAEEQINAMLVQIGQYIDQIDWMVFPDDQPLDLNQRLEARGMPGGPGGNWLWANLAALNAPPAVPADFHITLVRDDQGLVDWVRVSEEGFGQELGYFYDAYARHGYGPGAYSLHYTGYLGDTPVTSGTLLDAGGTASIFDISTIPAYRRMGFGGAITYALLNEIRNRGYRETWIWSSNMAKSVYQKLGYIEADFGQREHTWSREPVQEKKSP